MKSKTIFADLADLDEDRRIQIIGETVVREQKVVGVVTDSEPGKAERYIQKVLSRHPGVVLIGRQSGPVADTTLLRFGPKPKGDD